MKDKSNYFAEIVESSLTYVKVQSWDYTCIAPYGSLLAIEHGTEVVYGLVQTCITGTDDLVRTVYAYQKTYDELKLEYPHIFELLKTRCGVLVIGYMSDGCLHAAVSQTPVPLHAFVRHATIDEYRLFADCCGYIALLFSQAQQINVDELLVAFIVQLKARGLLDDDRLRILLHVYMELCGHDYHRVRLLNKRILAV